MVSKELESMMIDDAQSFASLLSRPAFFSVRRLRIEESDFEFRLGRKEGSFRILWSLFYWR